MVLTGSGRLSIVGDGGRKRVRCFLATFLGEELSESWTADSEDLKSLPGFLLLLVILNAADIVEELQKNFENLRQTTKHRYCGLGTGARVGAKNRVVRL